MLPSQQKLFHQLTKQAKMSLNGTGNLAFVIDKHSSGKSRVAHKLKNSLDSDFATFLSTRDEASTDDLLAFREVLAAHYILISEFVDPSFLPESSQQDTFSALASALCRATLTAKPVLIIIDDAQHLSQTELLFLFELSRFIETSRLCIVCLGTHTCFFQILESRGMKPTSNSCVSISFGPLNVQDMNNFLDEQDSLLVSKLDPQLKHKLITMSSSDLAFLKGLIEVLAIEAKSAHTQKLSEFRLPESLLAIVNERFQKLSHGAKRLADICSVFKSKVYIQIAAHILGVPLEVCYQYADECVKAGILVRTEELKFSSHQIQDIVSARLSIHQRQLYNFEIGTYLAEKRIEISDLKPLIALHLLDAGEKAKQHAAAACLEAAAVLGAAHAWQEEVHFLMAYLNLSPRTDSLWQVHEKLGKALMQLRDFDAAKSWLEKAIVQCPNSEGRSSIFAKLAFIDNDEKHLRPAWQSIQSALKELDLGYLVSQKPIANFFRTLVYTASAFLVSLVRRSMSAQQLKKESAILEKAGHIATFALMPQSMVLNFSLRHLGNSFRIGSSWESAKSYAIFSYLLCAVNFQRLSARFYSKSETMSKSVPYKMGLPEIQFYKVLSHVQRSEFSQSDAIFKDLLRPGNASLTFDLKHKLYTGQIMILLLRGKIKDAFALDEQRRESFPFLAKSTPRSSIEYTGYLFSAAVRRLARPELYEPLNNFDTSPYEALDNPWAVQMTFKLLIADTMGGEEVLAVLKKFEDMGFPKTKLTYYSNFFYVFKGRALARLLLKNKFYRDANSPILEKFRFSLSELSKIAKQGALFQANYLLLIGLGCLFDEKREEALTYLKNAKSLALKFDCPVVLVEATEVLNKIDSSIEMNLNLRDENSLGNYGLPINLL